MSDETRPEQDPASSPPDLPEQTAEAGETGPLPDLPDSAYPQDAVDLPPPDQDTPEAPALDAGDEDPDALAGDFTDSDVDLEALLGAPVSDEDGEG